MAENTSETAIFPKIILKTKKNNLQKRKLSV